MKTRMSLTIEESVLKDAKIYAKKHNTSISKIVEDYLKNLIENENLKK